jgi:hypothetical protein
MFLDLSENVAKHFYLNNFRDRHYLKNKNLMVLDGFEKG